MPVSWVSLDELWRQCSHQPFSPPGPHPILRTRNPTEQPLPACAALLCSNTSRFARKIWLTLLDAYWSSRSLPLGITCLTPVWSYQFDSSNYIHLLCTISLKYIREWPCGCTSLLRHPWRLRLQDDCSCGLHREM